jgi:hypothetical protein
MNDSAPSQITEQVYRRLEDPVRLFGYDLPPGIFWIAVLALVLVAAFIYVALMYSRDSRGVGPWWAAFLGFLRASVYVLLAGVFLLPALQTWEETEVRSKVLVLFDVSGSLTAVVDDIPDEHTPYDKLPTRQDKVLRFLADEKKGFLAGLEKKNPLTVARFATKMDSNPWFFADGANWTAEEREEQTDRPKPARTPADPPPLPPQLWYSCLAVVLFAGFVYTAWRFLNQFHRVGLRWATLYTVIRLTACGLLALGCFRLADRAKLLELEREERLNLQRASIATPVPPRPLQQEFWQSWLKPAVAVHAPDDWSDADKKRLERLVASNQKLAEAGFFSATNVTDSILALLNREVTSMVQGVVLFSDGRSTISSGQTLEDLQQRTRAAGIPVFVVGVGEERPQVRVEIVELRAPGQVQPGDKFRVVAEVYGEGLSDKEFDIALDATYTKKGKGGKEESLPILLVEPQDASKPDRKREEVNLGTKVTLRPVSTAKFDRSMPPRAEVEFLIDAATLAQAAGTTLTAGKKYEMGETNEGELKFRARVPKNKLEVFAAKEHVSDAADLRVINRPLRVLLFASAPTRDYQFIRTLLVREVDKKRAELTIHLQLPPGRVERRTGVVQDVPPDRLIPIFPDRLDAGSDKPDEKLLDLAEYDVIIAFDPDWTQLTEAQLKLLEKWVDNGGGLILIGGPINTLQLARPGANRDKLKPILDLYPITLKDIRIDEMDRKADTPWQLLFDGATPDMEFLKLDEGGEEGPPPFLSDWHEFFFGPGAAKKATAIRGIYNYYPAESTKPGAQVVARFGDPQAKLKDGVTQQPYLVLSDPNSGRRVVWIASGETWRLRQYRESFHERFWTKLTRYAGAKNQGRLAKRIQINMARTFTANRPVEIEAKIDAKGGDPLPRNARPPKVLFKLPPGVTEKEFPSETEMRPKQGQGHEGIFVARVQPRTPGEYGLEIKVPDTGDSESWRFSVKEANPEMDNTRPDFDTLWRLASPIKPVLERMTDDAAKTSLKQRLQRPKLEAQDSLATTSKDEAAGENSLRLFFDLNNAELIPSCMTPKKDSHRSRGAFVDQWDEGFPLPWWTDSAGEPVKMSWVLTAVVGLLSLEWLTRKLLRLA